MADWIEIKIKRNNRVEFKASTRSMRGAIKAISDKYYGGFPAMLDKFLGEDWVFWWKGEKIGELKNEDYTILRKEKSEGGKQNE